MNIGWLVMWVGAPVVIAGAIIILLTRRRSERPDLSRVETWSVGLIGSGALLVILAGVMTLFSAASVFTSDPTIVRGFVLGNAEVPPFTEKADAIVDAAYETVSLTVSGAPTETRWLIYAEKSLPTLGMIAIGAAVFWLALLLLRGRPFVRSLPRLAGVSALVVMLTGIGAQVFASAARASVVEYLDPQVITAGGNAVDPSYEGVAFWDLSLDLAPVGWALGLALVAAAFELGRHLQRDTEGLV